ncbi:hypothetical protein [Pseudomonas sp.]|uniref:hypothetical protein n=1 Tax=Pseudomonas sp. TaxID=306 RepID=UPI002735099A|nr:hypothetical protein [Pseudomonas sp.]MDP2746166.1 hypothetical protein [Pseudomonas sp.]
MPHNIQLQIIAALAVITLIGLAVWAYRAAQKAHIQGYDLGYDDAKRGHELRIDDLQHEVAHLQLKAANQHAAHQLDRDAIIQDALARIAIFARRAAACTEADLNTLTAAANQLGFANTTYKSMHAEDPARFAHQMQLQLINLAERMRVALQHPSDAQQLETKNGTAGPRVAHVEDAA